MGPRSYFYSCRGVRPWSYPALCLFRSRQTFRQLQSDQIILLIFAQDATSAHSTGRLQSFEVLPQDVLRLQEQKYLGTTSLANLLAPKRLEGEPSTVYGDVSDPSYSLKSLQRTVSYRCFFSRQGKGSAVWSVCQIWLQNWQMHVIYYSIAVRGMSMGDENSWSSTCIINRMQVLSSDPGTMPTRWTGGLRYHCKWLSRVVLAVDFELASYSCGCCCSIVFHSYCILLVFLAVLVEWYFWNLLKILEETEPTITYHSWV